MVSLHYLPNYYNMIHKINDIRKELTRVLERMEVGDTAEAPCEGKNVGYIRSFTTNINRGYTSKGQRKFKTSTYRKDMGIIDIIRIL